MHQMWTGAYIRLFAAPLFKVLKSTYSLNIK